MKSFSTVYCPLILIGICEINAHYQSAHVVDWNELDHAITEWFELRPFVIKNSPLSHWKLTKYLQQNTIAKGNKRIISYYEQNTDKRFSKIKTELRQTSCCFTTSVDECKEYVSGFLYNAWENRLGFWEQYELNYALIQQFKECTNSTVTEDMQMENVLNELYSIETKETKENPLKYSLYMNANIPLSMFKDVDGMQAFFNAFHVETTYGEWELYLWIGSKDGYANRHYDTTNNLFFILRGSKVFYLSPPSLSQFKVYSSLHNSWRQEILFNFGEEYDDDTVIMEAVLNEGDVLYIPPLWFHKVRNLNTSTIGVNMWWYSQIHDKMNNLWKLSIPIEYEWTSQDKLR